VFVVAGAIVYQATAPPPQPGSRRLSFSRMLEHIRRELRGNHASAEVSRSSIHPVAPAIKELRILEGFRELSITGEARDDIAIEMRIRSSGPDEPTAQQWAEAAALKVDTTATAVALKVDYPEEGRQRGTFVLKVPARLAVRIDQPSTSATISNVAGLEMVAARDDTTVKKIQGRVALSHVGGRLILEDVGSLKLTARRSEATLTTVRGDLSLEVQNGEVTAVAVTGPISVEARSSELTLSKLDQARGPVRVNAVGGSVALRGVATESRVDGRNTEIEIEMAKAVPVTVYNEGDEPVDVTPVGGYTLDALAASARISLPDGTLTISEAAGEQRANGPVNGGGPPITLRSNRGPINIRSK
jgi:hypothetical protein